MLADRRYQVRVRARFAGGVELYVKEGQRVAARQALVLVEGDVEMERLDARNPATIVSIEVADGAEVEEGALLMILQEDPPA